jgi:hypothetical protein
VRLYAAPTHFIRDTVHNQIAEKLRAAFDYYRFAVPGEVQSWNNSLRATAQVFEEAGLKDHGVLLEYQIPLTSRRLDCMITGRNGHGRENAVIIELKQWDGANEAVGDKVVTTWVGGREREMLHPSVQVGQYRMYLEDTHTAFHDGAAPIDLSACAYPNITGGRRCSLGCVRRSAERDPLSRPTMGARCHHHGWRPVGARSCGELKKEYRPSKKLLEHVATVIRDARVHPSR